MYRSMAWRLLRASVVEQAREANASCGICGRLIDFDASGQSRFGPSVDHVRPLVTGGAAFERSNIRVVHASCNGRKSGVEVYCDDETHRDEVETVMVAVCANRACRCSWLSDGPRDDCHLGLPLMRAVIRTKNGWVVQ